MRGSKMRQIFWSSGAMAFYCIFSIFLAFSGPWYFMWLGSQMSWLNSESVMPGVISGLWIVVWAIFSCFFANMFYEEIR